MVIGVMGLVGLVIDVGMLYAIKIKLSAAADGAALATARALGAASNGGASITTVGQAYFAANMPPSYMFSTNASMTDPVTTTNADGSQTVSVTATASFPLLFLRLLNNTQTVNVQAAATRRNLNLVMVLDRSGSMNTSGSCAPMVAAAQEFVNNFIAGQDALGLVVFGGSYDNTYGITKNFTSGGTTLSQKIGTITCGGNTGSAQALTIAHQMLSGLPSSQTTGAINAIVFFTDGQPNGLAADWPIATSSTAGFPYANSSGDSAGVGTTTVSPWFLGYPKSGCTATSISGVIARNGEQNTGIYGMVAPSIGSDAGAVSGTGCAFTSSTNDAHGQNLQKRVHEDVAYIPATDHYGNATTGYWDSAAGTTKQIINVGPYSGKVMIDFYQSGSCTDSYGNSNPCGLFNNNIDLASMNAAESAATSARTDANVPVIIFSIGLGGAADAFPGQFLEHVSNTTTSDLHSSHLSEPSGQYIYVTGKGQLTGAFQQIASFVLRLSS